MIASAHGHGPGGDGDVPLLLLFLGFLDGASVDELSMEVARRHGSDLWICDGIFLWWLGFPLLI
jgi:hypothetical protein